MKILTENVDYKLIEDPEFDFYLVQLITSEWAGVIYAYGKVTFLEQGVVKFNYKIFESKNLDTDSFLFKHHIGDVLTSIISNESC